MGVRAAYYFLIVTIFTGYPATPCLSDNSTTPGIMPTELDELISDDGPGLQYVVVTKDEIIVSSASGLSDVRNTLPLESAHTMAAFSMTKVLTAIAVLQLVEQNILRLNDRAIDYVEHPYDNQITIQQLVNHTSGIPDPIPLRWAHLAEKHNQFSEKTELRAILNKHTELDSSSQYPILLY